MNINDRADKAVIMLGFAYFKVVALAVAMGITFGLLAFIVVAVLVLQGFNSNFLFFIPWFSVSWSGSIIAALYFSFFGMLTGSFIAVIWNLTHIVYISLVVIRASWWKLMAE